MKRAVTIILALVGAFGAGWLGYRLSGAAPQASLLASPPAQDQAADPGQAMTRLLAMSYPDPSGRQQPLKQWQGKVMVVNFWATWCPPCREEMPGFSRLQLKYAASGVQFVGIGIDEPDKIKAFEKQFPVSYPLLMAGLDTMSLTADLGNTTEGLPFTLFIDRNGQLRSIKVGLLEDQEVERRLRELL